MPIPQNINIPKVQQSIKNISQESYEDLMFYNYQSWEYLNCLAEKHSNFMKPAKPQPQDLPYFDLRRGLGNLFPFMYFDENNKVKYGLEPEHKIDLANLTPEQNQALEQELLAIDSACKGQNKEKLAEIKDTAEQIKVNVNSFLKYSDFSKQETLKKLWIFYDASQLIYSDFGSRNHKTFYKDGQGNAFTETEQKCLEHTKSFIQGVGSIIRYVAGNQFGIHEQSTLNAGSSAHADAKKEDSPVFGKGMLTKEDYKKHVLVRINKGTYDIEPYTYEMSKEVYLDAKEDMDKHIAEYYTFEGKLFIDSIKGTAEEKAQNALDFLKNNRQTKSNKDYPNREHVHKLHCLYEGLKAYGMLTKDIAQQIKQEAKANSLNPFYAFFTGNMAERGSQQEFFTAIDNDIKRDNFVAKIDVKDEAQDEKIIVNEESRKHIEIAKEDKVESKITIIEPEKQPTKDIEINK